MLLYVVTNVTIKSNWSSLTELVNAIGKNDYENDNFQQTFDFHNSNKFEKIIEEDSRKIFVQNILNPKKIIDNDSKTLTIALSKGL
jgi:O-acetylhomoserine/O-acetylserine sulfhydrylase-like pyridoxal-dependent enzyme